MTQSLTDLATGHTFDPIDIVVDADRARAYRAAVGDESLVYEVTGFVPPLAVAALALGALLNQVGLPPGSLHVSESLEWTAPIKMGATLACSASLVQRSQRSGWIVSVLESRMHLDGVEVMKARASVMSPAVPQ